MKQVMFAIELTFIGHVVLRGTRIVVPQVLGKKVFSLAHAGHQGIIKTKETRDVDRRCMECYGFQLVTKNVLPPPVKPKYLPKQP